MSQGKLNISDSDATDCDEENASLNQFDSDSDKTIDSVELSVIIKRKDFKEDSTLNGRSEQNSSQKQSSHEISDSDSTDCEDDNRSTHLSKDLNQTVYSPKLDANAQLKRFQTVGKKTFSNVVTENAASTSRSDVNILPECKYGINCFRKNLHHLKNFRHPEGKRDYTGGTVSVRKKKKVDETKEENNSSTNVSECFRYNMFLTNVTGILGNYNDFRSIHISEILSSKNGNLVASVQFNYVIDIPWLMQKYPNEFRSKPLLIVHGHKDYSLRSLIQSASAYSNISFCQAKLEIAFGTHHTKMMFLHYEDGFRIVIHTANLIEQDWNQKTQGVWISNKYSQLTDTSSGDSDTHFKRDLIQYLENYRDIKLKSWIELIKKHDFSATKVHLIASVPGRFSENKKDCYGHLKLRKTLKECGPENGMVDASWPVIGQFSSIGSLGKDASQWLRGEWLKSLSTVKEFTPPVHNIDMKLVFPSVDDVRLSLEGYPAGGSLPYSKNTAYRQLYLNRYLHRWKSELHGRTHASPHIKSYMRVSPANTEIAWFFMTSANLSKAAWGALEKNGTQLMIRSYELGILFLPHSFKKSTFEVFLKNSKSSAFMIPYDLPLIKYTDKDKPWTWDEAHKEKPDRHGNMWCPP